MFLQCNIIVLLVQYLSFSKLRKLIDQMWERLLTIHTFFLNIYYWMKNVPKLCINSIIVKIQFPIARQFKIGTIHLDINYSFKEFFKVSFKKTTDTSIQCLQYRILHRILPTNYYLKKINVKILYVVWAFCKENMELIQHVYMICPEKLPLWNNLSMHIYRTTLNRFALMFMMYFLVNYHLMVVTKLLML